MTDATPVLGVLAGAIGVADTVPYVRDIRRGNTRPHRGTWLIWGVLAIVVCLSQRADGASWSLIMAGTQAAVTGLIFLLAIRRGEGGVSTSERSMIAVAGVGIIGWIAVHEPIVATACVIAADLIGAAMMVPKTYRDPGSETLATFAFASLGGALAAGAVGVLDISLLLYPMYFCLVNGAIALLIHQRRRGSGPPGPREMVVRGLGEYLDLPLYAAGRGEGGDESRAGVGADPLPAGVAAGRGAGHRAHRPVPASGEQPRGCLVGLGPDQVAARRRTPVVWRSS
jgi:hypothetical protein